MASTTQLSFTAIIPTRERADTLAAALRSATEQNYDRLEIIVCDNCSQDATEDVVRSFDDPRINYINTGKRLSMSKNWEFAISHVSTDWVTIIGDDDALLPNCFNKVANIAAETGVEAVRSTTCAYLWPGQHEASYGQLTVPMQTGFSVRNCREQLAKVLNGEAKYPTLPMLYNGGFVSTNAIRGAMHNGTLYRSCIPDVYSAVVLSNSLETYAYCYEPLAINGASRHSTGTSQFSLNPKAKKASQTFQHEGNIPFHPSIPMNDDGTYPKSLQAMVYESCAQANEVFPEILNLDPPSQLKVILATAGPHRASIEKWATKFSAIHDLDQYLQQLVVSSTQKRLADRIPTAINTLRALCDVESGNNNEDLKDVFHASLMAARVIESRPWLPLRVARRLAGKLSRKMRN